MNILHIGKYYPPFSGGIENFMGQLLPLLASAGHHITALVHNHCSGQSVQSEIMKHVKVIRVPSYGRLLYAPISPAFPFYLHRILKKSKPDLLHIHLPNTSAFWLLLLPSAHKIPWIIHWHSDVIGASPNKLVRLAYYLYQPLERLLLKNSQHIIVTSPHYQQSSEVLKPWLKKTQVIPLGISLKSTLLADQYKNKAEQLWSRNFKKKPHRLLSIGRLTYYKGHQYLIRAMLDLPESQLIIIGEGEEYQSLTRLITELKLEQQVLLTGKLNDQDLHALLASCDIFCLPSIERTEAFGLVLLEAMFYAKPTMVSKILGSGMTWVCQNNITGIHTNIADSHDIALQLKILLNKPDYCELLGHNGKQRLETHFNLHVIATMMLTLYQRDKHCLTTNKSNINQ